VAPPCRTWAWEAALKRNGIRMLRAPVGDRYVLEQMLAHNADWAESSRATSCCRIWPPRGWAANSALLFGFDCPLGEEH